MSDIEERLKKLEDAVFGKARYDAEGRKLIPRCGYGYRDKHGIPHNVITGWMVAENENPPDPGQDRAGSKNSSEVKS